MVFLHVQSVIYERVRLDQVVSSLTHSYDSTRSFNHDPEGCKHVLAKYIIAHVVFADEAANNLASVNADAHLDPDAAGHVLLVELAEVLEHVTAKPNCRVRFFNHVICLSLVFGHFAVVTHCHVDVTIRVHFVGLPDFAKVVKVPEKAR